MCQDARQGHLQSTSSLELLMKVKEVVKGAKQWTAKVRVQNPGYVGWVDAVVWAPNTHVARQMIKAQFRIQDWHVGSIKELR
jgi:hypothetical protein